MKFLKKLTGIGLATALGLSMVTSALANDTKTQDVEVTIQSGGMSLEVPSIVPLGNITLNKDRQTYKVQMNGPITIRDLTGSQAGWRLNVSATPLTHKDTSKNYQLPSGTLTLGNVTSITRVDSGNPSDKPEILSDSSNAAIDSATVTIARAEANSGKGMGSFELSFENNEALALHIDAATAIAGEYTTTVTWSLVTGP